MTDDRRCRVCDCTEDNPCQTPQGPCSWVDKGLCSACMVDLPPVHYMVPRTCRYCQRLIADGFRAGQVYTCFFGRFDDEFTPGAYHHWFAWSGIINPNRRVAQAQRHCPSFKLRPPRVVVGDPPLPRQRKKGK